MVGSLIISLDYELMWGVRDHRSVSDYGDAVMGGRTAIPLMLEAFQAHGIRATWATVGLLFCRNRDEMHDFAPQITPAYADPTLSPYADLARIGRDEAEDPLYFGRSLLDRIADTDGQEIATHTFGHVYALEPGMNRDAWRADLNAALEVAQASGHRLRSIVFPRNQQSETHIKICQSLGLGVYRGVARGWAYRSAPGEGQSLPVRAARFLDGIAPVFGHQNFDASNEISKGNVPASRFLRPWLSNAPAYSALHLRRICQEMTWAAKHGMHYHLWWHPHNMGRNTDRNMAQLNAILAHYGTLRERYGFQSRTMADCTTQETAA